MEYSTMPSILPVTYTASCLGSLPDLTALVLPRSNTKAHAIEEPQHCMSHHHLIILLTQLQNFNQLRQLHAHLLRRHSLHLSAHLLRHCGRLHSPLNYARSLFDFLPQPTSQSYANMFKLCSYHNAHFDTLQLFIRMRASGEAPESSVFPILVKACGRNAVQVHALIVKVGFMSGLYVRNVVLNYYAHYGPIDSARNLFDEMPERGIVDWNSMLSGYWKWSQKDDACRLFDLIPLPERNVVSWTVMVSGFSRVGELEAARRMFDSMPERNVVSWNAMLSGYAQNGMPDECLLLFGKMMSLGVQPNETTWVTVISACSSKGDKQTAESLIRRFEEAKINMNCFVETALIDMHGKCGSLAQARKVFDEMKNRNPATWNAMISAYVREGDLVAAQELFDKMPEKDIFSWNSMISGYVQHGQWARAIELFKQMSVLQDMKPDEFTISSVVSACGHLGILEFGKWVMKYISEHQISLSVSAYNALIFMYSRCGSLEDAKKTFEEMAKRDVFSYNSLISGLAANGDGLKALELVKTMEAEGIEPDAITYIGVLTACSHAGLLDEGFQIFQTIRSPTVDHYACMVHLLGRAGRLDEAKELIDKMPMSPHPGVYGALLDASRTHKRVDIGELAARKLFELEPKNSGNYILLSNIYASDRRWEEVESLRRLMRARAVVKMVGCSWIEFDGKIYRFIAGDRSHHRSPEIYQVLEELYKRMSALGYVADRSCVLRDVEDEEKEDMVRAHSEKLAIGFALLAMEEGAVIRVVKNLRICEDCHHFIKMVSELMQREILVRDNSRFHCFKDGICSCRNYW